MKPPGGDSHDIFGADFSGTPSHHRVLKPPGGGTSDIFNGNNGGTPSGGDPPRRVRNMQPSSKLFGEDTEAAGQVGSPAKPPGPGNGSHWRLFGPPPSSPPPPSASKTPNARLFGSQESPTATDGNPVTGEGYEEKNGTVSSSSSDAGSVTSSNGGTNGLNNGGTPAKPRARVPPGGYSSGFW